MKRFALLVGLLIVLLTFGCGKQEQAEEKTAPEAAVAEAPETATEAPQQATEPAEKATETSEPAIEEMKQSADNAAEKTGEELSEVKQKASELAEAATQAAEKKAAEVADTVESAAKAGKETVTETVGTVEQKASAVMEALTRSEAAEGNIIIASSYGNVTFNHTKHSETIDCATCHGEGEPGPLTMGKDQAHKVCKGCHMEKAAGPTKCSACHVK